MKVVFTVVALFFSFSLAKANPLATQTVGVKGMVCAFCAQGITKKFQAQKEVDKVEVSLEKKYVTLTYKEGEKLSNEKIGQILKDAGYEAVFNN